MKWIIALVAVLAFAVAALLISRLPDEDAIRLAGYAATAAFAALISFVLRWRAGRARRNRRAG
jgi:drug/metabolite transporter (DMT)-like permease